MFSKIKSVIAVLALAAMPVGASASTIITDVGVTGSPINCIGCGTPNIGVIDVNVGASFDIEFEDSDDGVYLAFDLQNNSLTNTAVTLAFVTIKQGGSLFGFTGGVEMIGAVSESIGEGVLFAQQYTFNIAAQSSVWFDFEAGDPYATASTYIPNIDFTITASPIPIPAAGFLLMGALGGLGFAGRRRRKAA